MPGWVRALLVPAALLVPGVTAVGLLTWSPERARVAGLAAARSDGSVTARRLATRPADVVVLGNSVTSAAVSGPMLGDLLGDAEVTVVTSPGSLAPTWYVMARDDVLTAEVAPRWVVLVNPTRTLVSVRPGSQLAWQELAARVGEDEPVLRRVMGVDAEPWATAFELRLRAAMARDAWFDATRDAGIRLALWSELGDVGDAALHSRVTDASREVYPPSDVPLLGDFRGDVDVAPPAASFLPALAEAVAARDAELVLAFAPTLDPAGQLAPDEVAALEAWASGSGVRTIDLRAGFEDGQYRDGWHLGERGARAFTRRLAGALAELLGPAARGASVADGGRGQRPVRVTKWPEPEALGAWTLEGACGWRVDVPVLAAVPGDARATLPVGLRPDGEPAPPRGEAEGCDGTWTVDERGLRWARAGAPPPTRWAWVAPRVAWGDDLAVWMPPGAQLLWQVSSGDADVVARVTGRAVGPGQRSAVRMGFGVQASPVSWTGDAFRRERVGPPPHQGTWTFRVDVGAAGPLVVLASAYGGEAP